MTAEKRFARRLRGFGPVGLAAIAIVLAGGFTMTLLAAVLALVWAWLSRTPWRELGFVRPKSWAWTLIIGIFAGVVLKLIMKTVVMPLLGGPAINPAYHYLAGNTAALPGILFSVMIGAGLGEEVLFRSYMFERLGKVLGNGIGAKATIVCVTSALFALAHYIEQGLPGVEQAVFAGLFFGSVFAVTGSILFPMIVHAAFDLVAVAIIYYDVETGFAHFFFK